MQKFVQTCLAEREVADPDSDRSAIQLMDDLIAVCRK